MLSPHKEVKTEEINSYYETFTSFLNWIYDNTVTKTNQFSFTLLLFIKAKHKERFDFKD